MAVTIDTSNKTSGQYGPNSVDTASKSAAKEAAPAKVAAKPVSPDSKDALEVRGGSTKAALASSTAKVGLPAVGSVAKADGAERLTDAERLHTLGTLIKDVDARIAASQADLDQCKLENATKIAEAQGNLTAAQANLHQVQNIQKQSERKQKLPAAEAAVRDAQRAYDTAVAVVATKERTHEALVRNLNAQRDSAIDDTVIALRGPEVAKLKTELAPFEAQASAISRASYDMGQHNSSVDNGLSDVSGLQVDHVSLNDRYTLVQIQNDFRVGQPAIDAGLEGTGRVNALFPPADQIQLNNLPDLNWMGAKAKAGVTDRELEPPMSAAETRLRESAAEHMNEYNAAVRNRDNALTQAARTDISESDRLLWKSKAETFDATAHANRLEAERDTTAADAEASDRLHTKRAALGQMKTVVTDYLRGLDGILDAASNKLAKLGTGVEAKAQRIRVQLTGIRTDIINQAIAAAN